MPLSGGSIDYFGRRNKQLDNLKANTKIGIFGSFYKTNKPDLLSLKKFLSDCGYNVRISEDLDPRTLEEKNNRDPAYDRKLSENLIMESDFHLFILPGKRDNEPDNLIQSVSMEIERLHTLDECGEKSAKYVAVYTERGLIGTMGGVCEGLFLTKKDDWVIFEYVDVTDIFKPARQFCLNCIMDMYSY